MPMGVTITMINNCKTISVLALMLTLTVGIAFATTSPQQQVLAQNMTTGNNATEGGNMTGELNQTGSISSSDYGVPDSDGPVGPTGAVG